MLYGWGLGLGLGLGLELYWKNINSVGGEIKVVFVVVAGGGCDRGSTQSP